MANGVELATAYVSLTVDGSKIGPGVRRSLGSVEAQADRVGKTSGRRMGDGISKGIVSSVGRIAGPLAAIFATVGIGKFISGTLDEAREAQKVSAVTDSIVKSTGGVAKVTAKHVGDLSTAISNKIGVDDEAIQAGANLLLTFKNVRNEVGKNNKVFDQAVGLAQDLSKAGFGSAEGAAKMLGKALNDPVKGMTALGRAGVTFTDAQKKQVKDAVKHNDLLKAQQIILGEVKSQVGGVAAATATTGDKVGVAFGNLKESIGTALLPVLDKFGGWFLDKGLPAIQKFGVGLSGLGKILFQGDFVGAAKTFGFAEDSAAVDFLFRVRDAAVAAFDGLRQFGGFVKNDVVPALQKMGDVILPALRKALGDVSGGVGGASVNWQQVGDVITKQVIPAMTWLIANVLPQIVYGVKAVIEVVKALWGAFQFFIGVVTTVGNVVLTVFIKVNRAVATLLDALSHVPGFGWAKDAANKLRDAADEASGLKDAINDIPTNKNVTVTISAAYENFRQGERDAYGSVLPKKKRAHGGPVIKGQPYLVGELRPEVFVPDVNGKILPRVPSPSGMAAATGGIDYYRLADILSSTMQRTPLSVGVAPVAHAVNSRNGDRRAL